MHSNAMPLHPVGGSSARKDKTTNKSERNPNTNEKENGQPDPCVMGLVGWPEEGYEKELDNPLDVNYECKPVHTTQPNTAEKPHRSCDNLRRTTNEAIERWLK